MCGLSFSLVSFQAISQTYQEIKEDPRIYSMVLWFDAVTKEGFDEEVESTLNQALTQLRAADALHHSNDFTKVYPESYHPFQDRTILISQTPQTHWTSGSGKERKIALPFYLFLEENPAWTIAFHIAALYKGPEEAGKYLDRPRRSPEISAAPDYVRKIRGSQRFRLEDFVTLDDIEHMTIRFRVLTDQEGIMVAVPHETRLIELLEGDPEHYPIQEIPISRILHRVELQLLKKLITDLRVNQQDREEYVQIGETAVSFVLWSLLDWQLRTKFKTNGWIRRPARLGLFMGGFFLLDGPIDAAVTHTGLKSWVTEANVEERKRYEETLHLLMNSLEKAKLGTLNLPAFQREFSLSLGLTYDEAKSIYLLDEEKVVLDTVENDFNRFLKEEKKEAESNLVKIQSWIKRLKAATPSIDRSTGLTSFALPPREPSLLEKTGDGAIAASALGMGGELLYNRCFGINRILYTGRIFGGITVSALVMNYVLGTSSTDPITLAQDQKETLEEELEALEPELQKVIQTYELLLKPY